MLKFTPRTFQDVLRRKRSLHIGERLFGRGTHGEEAFWRLERATVLSCLEGTSKQVQPDCSVKFGVRPEVRSAFVER